MQLPITIGLHRSRFVDTLVGALALLASLAILAFPRSLVLQVAILVVIWGIAVQAWRRSSPGVSMLRLERDGGVSVAEKHGDEFAQVELLPPITVHPWLCVLHLKTEEGQPFSLVLAADTLATNDFRRLRVFLRWRAGFSEPDGAI